MPGSLRHQSVEVAMNCYSIGLMLLVMSSAPLFAERGGWADALQNYLGQNRNPRLLLQIEYEKIRLYFRVSDLIRGCRRCLVGSTRSVEFLANRFFGGGSVKGKSENRRVVIGDFDGGPGWTELALIKTAWLGLTT